VAVRSRRLSRVAQLNSPRRYSWVGLSLGLSNISFAQPGIVRRRFDASVQNGAVLCGGVHLVGDGDASSDVPAPGDCRAP
jgi:hypothetical protein